MSLFLAMPAPEHEERAWRFVQSFEGGTINGSNSLVKTKPYSLWLSRLEASRAGNLPGRVPSTTLFAFFQPDGPIAAVVDIRHSLSDASRYAGHIGYSVAPAFRARGVGTAVLQSARSWAADHLGLSRVLLSCREDNPASCRVIEKNQGRPIGRIFSPEGEELLLFEAPCLGNIQTACQNS